MSHDQQYLMDIPIQNATYNPHELTWDLTFEEAVKPCSVVWRRKEEETGLLLEWHCYWEGVRFLCWWFLSARFQVDTTLTNVLQVITAVPYVTLLLELLLLFKSRIHDGTCKWSFEPDLCCCLGLGLVLCVGVLAGLVFFPPFQPFAQAARAPARQL